MSIAPRASTVANVVAILTANPPFGIAEEVIAGSSFVFGANVSTAALAQSSSSVAKLQGAKTCAKGGVLVLRRVSGTPAAPGEFAITGSTITIAGDITGGGDSFAITYPTA